MRVTKEKDLLKSIDNRLKWLIRLQVKQSLEDKKSKEQIKTLYRMGFEPGEIGEMLDKTKNNVSAQISQMRSKGEIDG